MLPGELDGLLGSSAQVGAMENKTVALFVEGKKLMGILSAGTSNRSFRPQLSMKFPPDLAAAVMNG
jgi:hypothetical protein